MLKIANVKAGDVLYDLGWYPNCIACITMGDWEPEKTETVDGATIYFWTVPEKKM